MPPGIFNTLRFMGYDMIEANDDIAASLGEMLRDRGETVATAESATGGLVSSLLTDVPGASDYVDRGFVTYAYEAKTGTLAVDRAVIDQHGAVSEPVAAAMARAARDLAGTTWGVSVTGIAGPSGGTAKKPVGTTFVGVAHAGPWGSGESSVDVSRYVFSGERHEIKRSAAEQALSDLATAIGNLQ